MKKLKSLKEFNSSGLELKKSEMLNVSAGLLAQTYYFQDTTVPSSDCLRCAKEDNPYIPSKNRTYKCVYV